MPGLGDYCASKSGAFAIDESVRAELIKLGIYVQCEIACRPPLLASGDS